MKSYFYRLLDWKHKHKAMHPITDINTNETCYTFEGVADFKMSVTHQITVRDLGGFNLVHYAKPVVVTLR